MHFSDLLCRIGIHKYVLVRETNHAAGYIWHYKTCERCATKETILVTKLEEKRK